MCRRNTADDLLSMLNSEKKRGGEAKRNCFIRAECDKERGDLQDAQSPDKLALWYLPCCWNSAVFRFTYVGKALKALVSISYREHGCPLDDFICSMHERFLCSGRYSCTTILFTEFDIFEIEFITLYKYLNELYPLIVILLHVFVRAVG